MKELNVCDELEGPRILYFNPLRFYLVKIANEQNMHAVKQVAVYGMLN